MRVNEDNGTPVGLFDCTLWHLLPHVTGVLDFAFKGSFKSASLLIMQQ